MGTPLQPKVEVLKIEFLGGKCWDNKVVFSKNFRFKKIKNATKKSTKKSTKNKKTKKERMVEIAGNSHDQ